MDKDIKVEKIFNELSDKMKEAKKNVSEELIEKFNASLGIFKYVEDALIIIEPMIKQLDKNISPVYEKAKELKIVLDKIEVVNTVWKKLANFGSTFDGFKQMKKDLSGYI